MIKKNVLKIQSVFNVTHFVLYIVGLYLVCILAGLSIIAMSYQDLFYKLNLFHYVFLFLVIFLVFFFSSCGREEYLSDIEVTPDEIIFIYKTKFQISKTQAFKRDEVTQFNLIVNTFTYSRYTEATYAFEIYINGCKSFYYGLRDSHGGNSFDFNIMYKALKFSKKFPDLKVDLCSSKSINHERFKYYVTHGKKMPFFVVLYKVIKEKPFDIKLQIVIYFSLFFFAIFFILGPLVYLALPDIPYSEKEKQYLEYVKKGFNYNQDLSASIFYLDKAKELVSTDPYLYQVYAQIYKNEGYYLKSIEYSKLGLKNKYGKKVKELNKRQYKTDYNHVFYSNIYQCYLELNDIENAIETYNYLLKNRKGDYYTRGKLYYKIDKFEEAKKDFIKHRRKMIRNKMSQFYIDEINELIKNCEKYID